MTPESPRPALTPEREKELLGLIEAYWRIKCPPRADGTSRVSVDGEEIAERFVWVQERENTSTDHYESAWAESEACLREVFGEIGVRGKNVHFTDIREVGIQVAEAEIVDGHWTEDEWVYGTDDSRPVALLKAFVSAFGQEKT